MGYLRTEFFSIEFNWKKCSLGFWENDYGVVGGGDYNL